MGMNQAGQKGKHSMLREQPRKSLKGKGKLGSSISVSRRGKRQPKRLLGGTLVGRTPLSGGGLLLQKPSRITLSSQGETAFSA